MGSRGEKATLSFPHKCTNSTHFVEVVAVEISGAKGLLLLELPRPPGTEISPDLALAAAKPKTKSAQQDSGSGAWTRTKILGSKGPCATNCTTPELLIMKVKDNLQPYAARPPNSHDSIL